MTNSLLGIDAVMGLALTAVAIGTLLARDLFQAVVLFIVFGLLMTIAWCRLGAVDVALAEAAIGAGLTGALLLNTLAAIRRHPGVSHRSDAADQQNRKTAATVATADDPLRTGLFIGATALFSASALAVIVIPMAGPTAASRIAADAELPPSGVSNPVTAVLLNFRAYDTMLEVAVLLAAVLAVLPLSRSAARAETGAPLGPVLTAFIRLIVPLAILVATYVLWIGTKAPGGAFQAAAILSAVAVLLILGGASPPTDRLRRWRVLLVGGLAVFLLVAVEGIFSERRFLEYRTDWAGASIIVVEAALTVSIAVILTMLFSCIFPAGSKDISNCAADSRTPR